MQTREVKGPETLRDTDQSGSGDLRPAGTQTREVRGLETHRDTDQRRSGDLRPSGTQTRGTVFLARI